MLILLMEIRFVWSIITPRPTVYDVQMRIIEFLEVGETRGQNHHINFWQMTQNLNIITIHKFY